MHCIWPINVISLQLWFECNALKIYESVIYRTKWFLFSFKMFVFLLSVFFGILLLGSLVLTDVWSLFLSLKQCIIAFFFSNPSNVHLFFYVDAYYFGIVSSCVIKTIYYLISKSHIALMYRETYKTEIEKYVCAFKFNGIHKWNGNILKSKDNLIVCSSW